MNKQNIRLLVSGELALWRQGLTAAALGWVLLAAPSGHCASNPVLSYTYSVADGKITFAVPENPAFYYTLESSTDLRTFTPVGMSLGSPAPVWAFTVPLSPAQGFFRVLSHWISDPGDGDGDGIDDRYEMEHPGCLNSNNYDDASQVCLDPHMSNYQKYLRDTYGEPGKAPQFYSREASVFNLGAPTAPWEAISREATVWNFGSPSARIEAISKEVSVYSALPGSGPPMTEFNQVYSREATVWNFGSPSARIEAISKEVSVYSAMPGSGPPMTEFNQVYSREASIWNFGAPTARFEAISREVSVLNFEDPQHP